jgi:hypothetical protein
VEAALKPTGSRGHRAEVKIERTRHEVATEQVLFLFPRDETTPWVLRAGEARFVGLGNAMRPTVMENFLATLAILRQRAPHAAYDERFLAHPLLQLKEASVRGQDTVTPPLGDLGIAARVHLLGRILRQGAPR